MPYLFPSPDTFFAWKNGSEYIFVELKAKNEFIKKTKTFGMGEDEYIFRMFSFNFIFTLAARSVGSPLTRAILSARGAPTTTFGGPDHIKVLSFRHIFTLYTYFLCYIQA